MLEHDSTTTTPGAAPEDAAGTPPDISATGDPSEAANPPVATDARARRPRRRRAAVREPGPPAPVEAGTPDSPGGSDRADPDAQVGGWAPEQPADLDRPRSAPEPDPQPEDVPELPESPGSQDAAGGATEPDAQAQGSAPESPEPPASPGGGDQPRQYALSAAVPSRVLPAEAEAPAEPGEASAPGSPPGVILPAFVAPEPLPAGLEPAPDAPAPPAEAVAGGDTSQDAEEDEEEAAGGRRRRRGRRGRGRGRADEEQEESTDVGEAAESPPRRNGATSNEVGESGQAAPGGGDTDSAGEGGARRRRRRRRRAGSDGEDQAPESAAETEEVPTVVHVRPPRAASAKARDGDDVQGVKGSTRLEAKRQRRRESRDGGRKRPAVLSESEFLARREAVDRVMVVRQARDRTQIGVLEDGVLVEHYVTRATAASYVGNVYLGRVQNVLPSMEAAFVDIGKGRNAVLYAGEVNYDASQFEGKPHRIEQALKSGDKVLVQVSKDPIGSKGSRLTSQISLPGRYVVYIPEGQRTGISRKLPDTERARLKSILKRVAPPDAGLIVRTAAEGASEEELARDMARLVAQWEVIQQKAGSANPPALLHAEPDLVIRVIRDVFNEDFTRMVVSGDGEWDTIEAYVEHVAPDLRERLERWTGDGDVFAAYRVDEQLAKALDRRVWLPSGGYLVFDRTEAMVVVDVNTGKFTGKGGNLEETVTRNNLEAAEELVRQLRLRDLGGIIVVDFIDMVLEANRDLVLRRLLECLGRDRTKHQVAEVTSLGLVQMTRKRVGQGLQDVFDQVCPECNGRGVKTIIDPFQPPEEQSRPVPRPIPRRGTRAERPSAAPGPNGHGGPAQVSPEVGDPAPKQVSPEAANSADDPAPAPVSRGQADSADDPAAAVAAEPDETLPGLTTDEAAPPGLREPEALDPTGDTRDQPGGAMDGAAAARTAEPQAEPAQGASPDGREQPAASGEPAEPDEQSAHDLGHALFPPTA